MSLKNSAYYNIIIKIQNIAHFKKNIFYLTVMCPLITIYKSSLTSEMRAQERFLCTIIILLIIVILIILIKIVPTI